MAVSTHIENDLQHYDSFTLDERLQHCALQHFLNKHHCRVVSTDKTNRCLLLDEADYVQKGRDFLTNSSDYVLMRRDPNETVARRANSLLSEVKKLKTLQFKGGILINYFVETQKQPKLALS